MARLSVIIPAFNEERFIQKAVELSLQQEVGSCGIQEKEIIVVNDGSTDRTAEILAGFGDRVRIIHHEKNAGLTAAMMTGLRAATGDFILIQHSDLEYVPSDWPLVLQPLADDRADLVIGSRYMESGKKHFSHSYQMGGKVLTAFFNFLYGTKLTDIFSALRAFKPPLLEYFSPRAKGFAFETEFTAQAVRHHQRILEVPVSFFPRNFQEGKKLHWYDAFDVLKGMIRNRF